jgi:hypothetical protein
VKSVSTDGYGCKWVVRTGHEPFAVLPCGVCLVPVDIFEGTDGAARISCPICGQQVKAARLYRAMEQWNAIVGD